MNTPGSDAVCVRNPLVACIPVQALPFAPPPLAVQLLAFCWLQLMLKLSPSCSDLDDPASTTVGEPIVTHTVAVAAGNEGSTLGQLIEYKASVDTLATGSTL